jgi:hypothetical protein
MKEVRSRRHAGSIWATPSGSPWATVDISRPSCLADAEPAEIRHPALTRQGRRVATSDDRDAVHTLLSPLRAMSEIAR